MAQQKAAAQTTGGRVQGLIGTIAFIVGIVIGVIGGVASPDNGTLILTLVILGLIVGLLNITAKEMVPFLIAAIALVVLGNAGFEAINDIISGLGTMLDDIVYYIASFMAPAALVTAIKVLAAAARPG
ncbi:MAG: hypothetical protein HYX82_00760 [Chloroflexi bacterium]|nr:hypothetical protein [Chloroflexota bacterium]